jgi:hypothetical protein
MEPGERRSPISPGKSCRIVLDSKYDQMNLKEIHDDEAGKQHLAIAKLLCD